MQVRFHFNSLILLIDRSHIERLILSFRAWLRRYWTLPLIAMTTIRWRRLDDDAPAYPNRRHSRSSVFNQQLGN